MSFKIFILFVGFSIITLFCASQNNNVEKIKPVEQDNRMYSVDMKSARNLYDDKFYEKHIFLNGKEYKPYHFRLNTSPLFDASFGMEGTIFVNGESYSDIMLAYDIHKDQLIYVTSLFRNHNYICMNRALVDSFIIVKKETTMLNDYKLPQKHYHFKRIDFPTNCNMEMQDGYFETATSGNMLLLIHHEAILANNEGAEAVINGIFKYNYSQKKILKINESYYDITSKRKFVGLFKDKRKTINKKLNSFGVRYALLNKEQLVETLQLINSI